MLKSFEIKKKYLILLAMCGALISLDQATKIYIHTHFSLGEERVILQNFFSFTYIRNYGAAFGFMRDAQESFRQIFFMAVTPIALFVILMILRGVPERDRLSVFALSSVFAGAIGNYIDRIRLGYVIDFLDFYIGRGLFGSFPESSVHWPAFNVADMAIVCGVFTLFYVEWLRYAEAKKLEREQKTKTSPA